MSRESEGAEDPASRPDRITALDGLRGLAASSVVLAHALSVPAKSLAVVLQLAHSPVVLFANGLGGVHIFFVLSGFCLSGAARRAWGMRGLAAFYARRVLRIHPPYVAGLLISWSLAVWVFDAGDGADLLSHHIVELRRLRLHIPWSKFFWALSFPGEAFGHLPVGWTLYVEMVFSFLLPFMLWLATRWHWLLLVAISVPALIFAPDTMTPHRIFQPSFARFTLDFALGIAIHAERERLASIFGRSSRWGTAASIIAALLVLASPRYFGLDLSSPKVSLLLYVGGATVLVASAIHSPGFRRLLSWGPIAWIGRISFSVYLIHMPVILLLTPWIDHELGFWGTTLFVVTCLFVTYVVAPILYHFVEEPCIRLGHRASERIVRGGAFEPALER